MLNVPDRACRRRSNVRKPFLVGAFYFCAWTKIHPDKLFTTDIYQPVQSCEAGLKPVGGQCRFSQALPNDWHLHQGVPQ
jgi:hypothetical protein